MEENEENFKETGIREASNYIELFKKQKWNVIKT